MNLESFYHHRDIAVFLTTMAAGIFALGFGLGERNLTLRLRAQAECPAGEDYYKKVFDLAKMEVRCYYYAKKGSAR